MIAPGKQSKQAINPEEVAHYTLNAFMRHVPAAVPSINFLSGGIPADIAHQCLHEMNDMVTYYLGVLATHLQEHYKSLACRLGSEAENATSAQAKLLEYAQKNSESLADFQQ